MDSNGGLPLEAEYDEILHVVTASRILTVPEHTDAGRRDRAETEAQAAVDTLMDTHQLEYNDAPQTIWLAMRPLAGGSPTGHHVEFRARVRSRARQSR